MFTKFPAFVAGNVAWNTRIRSVTHAPTKFPPIGTADKSFLRNLLYFQEKLRTISRNLFPFAVLEFIIFNTITAYNMELKGSVRIVNVMHLLVRAEYLTMYTLKVPSVV